MDEAVYDLRVGVGFWLLGIVLRVLPNGPEATQLAQLIIMWSSRISERVE